MPRQPTPLHLQRQAVALCLQCTGGSPSGTHVAGGGGAATTAAVVALVAHTSVRLGGLVNVLTAAWRVQLQMKLEHSVVSSDEVSQVAAVAAVQEA